MVQLTERGRERARALRNEGEGRAAQPLKAHRRVMAGERHVVLLLVDEREGGGSHRAESFGSLMSALERADVRFETRWLPPGSADYLFVLASRPAEGGPSAERALPGSRVQGPGSTERALPLIVERKSAGDVPSSLKCDARGVCRWDRQRIAMHKRNKEVFGGAASVQ